MKSKIIIISLVLILSNFLGFIEIHRVVKMFLIFSLILKNFRSVSNYYFHKELIVYFVGLILSILSCYIFRQQSIIYSVIGLVNYWSLGLFFYFAGKQFSKEDLFDSLVILGKIVIIAYIVQYVLLQKGININIQDDFTANPELARLRINCSASIFFIFFFEFQTFIKKHRLLSFVWLFITIVVALLMNFRSIILGMVVFSILELVTLRVKLSKIILITIFIVPVLIAFSTTTIFQDRFEQMMSRQEEQTLSNSDYIRVIQFDYYQTKHFNNSFEHFMGSGLPDGHSKYSDQMMMLINECGLRYVDWGIIGLSWILGITTVIGIILYVFKAARLNVNMPCLNIWFLFLLVVSILTFELPREGNFLVQALAMAYLVKSDTGKKYGFKCKRLQ